MITAPFNFVPLSEKVFFPSWADKDKVSHDIPMTDDEGNLDSESGEIDITIEAKSPIFIRDGKEKEKFCQHNGQYYIPGSSVKGMVRSVLEILSFSKMRPETHNDDTYAVRDLNNREVYMDRIGTTRHCGWLYKQGDDYKIIDCKEPYRVSYDEIEKKFNKEGFKERFLIKKSSLESKLSKEEAEKYATGSFDNAKSPLKKAEEKYKLLGLQDSSNKTIYDFVHILTDKPGKRKIALFKEHCTNEQIQQGIKQGKLVLTGHPTARKEAIDDSIELKASGKIYDFLFEELENPDIYTIHKDDDIIKNFKFAYFDDHGKDKNPPESPDWAFWKKKLKKGEKVPVFFQVASDDSEDENKVLHFGLSFLYKLPYKYSVKHGIPTTHDDERKDLSQAIFGYIDNETKNALKGRISFSHFKTNQTKQLKPISRILGSPRASYYPLYIRQSDGLEYTTYMDDNFMIAGRKRYPIHKIFNDKIGREEKKLLSNNSKIGTTFTPLPINTVFKGKLRYHNLKKIELGAILSALTFHNTPDTYHNIGLAKSLGYGKIDVKIESFQNIKDYLKEFENEITKSIYGWSDSGELKELITMASEQNNKGNSELKYIEKVTEFAKLKQVNEKIKKINFLRNYSKLENIETKEIKSFLSEDDVKKIKTQSQHKRDWEYASISENYVDIENYIKKYPDSPHLEEARAKIEKLQNLIEDKKNAKKNEGLLVKLEGYKKEKNIAERKRKLEDLKEENTDEQIAVKIQEALDELQKDVQAVSQDAGIEFVFKANNINDLINRFKKITEKDIEISQTQKEKISEFIVDLISSKKANSKAQKKFWDKSGVKKILSEDEINTIKAKIKDKKD